MTKRGVVLQNPWELSNCLHTICIQYIVQKSDMNPGQIHVACLANFLKCWYKTCRHIQNCPFSSQKCKCKEEKKNDLARWSVIASSRTLSFSSQIYFPRASMDSVWSLVKPIMRRLHFTCVHFAYCFGTLGVSRSQRVSKQVTVTEMAYTSITMTTREQSKRSWRCSKHKEPHWHACDREKMRRAYGVPKVRRRSR